MNPRSELLAQRLGRLHALHERHIGVDALALDRVRVAHHRGLGHLLVRDERAFHLGRAEAVAAVGPAHERAPLVRIAVVARHDELGVGGDLALRRQRDGADRKTVLPDEELLLLADALHVGLAMSRSPLGASVSIEASRTAQPSTTSSGTGPIQLRTE